MRKCEGTNIVIVATSAQVDYLQGGYARVVKKVDGCLGQDLVGIGDLIYCVLMQGIRSPQQRQQVSSLFLSLPQFEMGGFGFAKKNSRELSASESKGVTIRKTINALISTFCAEHGFHIVHNDSDFTLRAKHIDLDIIQPHQWVAQYAATTATFRASRLQR